MNEEAQRIAIAEACGWKEIETLPMGPGGFEASGSGPYMLPNYLNSLDAMHEAVAHVCGERGFPFQQEYIRTLRAIVTRRRRDLNDMQADYWMAEADSAQRAEAFLRTLNLWKESPTK